MHEGVSNRRLGLFSPKSPERRRAERCAAVRPPRHHSGFPAEGPERRSHMSRTVCIGKPSDHPVLARRALACRYNSTGQKRAGRRWISGTGSAASSGCCILRSWASNTTPSAHPTRRQERMGPHLVVMRYPSTMAAASSDAHRGVTGFREGPRFRRKSPGLPTSRTPRYPCQRERIFRIRSGSIASFVRR